MDGARDCLLDIGTPTSPRIVHSGNHARHVLIGCDGWETDPDTETDHDCRKRRLLHVSDRKRSRKKSSMHEHSPERGTTPGEKSWSINLDGGLTGGLSLIVRSQASKCAP